MEEAPLSPALLEPGERSGGWLFWELRALRSLAPPSVASA